MAKIIILGSGYAIPDENHDNTHLIILGEERSVLVDCASNPVVRLQQAGVDLKDLTDLILTHFHPDHVSGVPLLLMNLWLQGRKKTLNIYGLEHTLTRMKAMMQAFGWESWPNFYPVNFEQLPENGLKQIIQSPEFLVSTAQVCHMIPAVGLRIKFIRNDQTFVYTSDTEPCQSVIDLAQNCDVLLHEAAGASPGHSSAGQAGETASQVNAAALYLIHYPTGENFKENLIAEAKQKYQGPVTLAQDFMEFTFD